MKKYRNPPIARMLCTLNFKRSDTNAWNSVYIGSIYEKVKDIFPKSEDRIRMDHTIDVATGELSIKRGKETFFLDGESHTSMALSENKLEFSQDMIYSGWESNSPKIIKVLENYLTISKQPLLERIDLRYINKIFIPCDTVKRIVEEKDYFNVYINYKTIGKDCNRFEIRISFPYTDGILDVILFPVPSPNNSNENLFILDLCYHIINIKDTNIKQVKEALDSAHSNIEDVFEKTLTQKTKDLFK